MLSSRVPGLRMRRWKRQRVVATPLPNYDAARARDERLHRFMATIEMDAHEILAMNAWLFKAQVSCGTPDCDADHEWSVPMFTN